MIQEAEEKNADPKIRYEVCGLETYGYPADSFDCVISNLVLHYVRTWMRSMEGSIEP
ncbi:class I SAM-dependent methyltransferase [[Clostridium] scindens]|nr:class I SAM-dependent methyltransferase [[Clostridium] scindens]MCI6395679.1 class I SAM-dependent methyltransferase [[Clostridium] scindens]MDY4867725.1 class I SAM-dependent methyltransferase [[Clostridium] scindens]